MAFKAGQFDVVEPIQPHTVGPYAVQGFYY